MPLIIITFLSGIFLSCISAYYSIVGLVAIFPTVPVSIIIMGIGLEIAKLVTAVWLKVNWSKASFWMKSYLMTAVAILMFITSIGCFGYLSKAHLEQTLVAGDYSVELRTIDREIQNQERSIQNAQRSLDALDRIVSEANPDTVVQIRNRQARERTQLLNTISNSSNNINDLNNRALPLRKESLAVEAKVGPIKYIADLIYGESDEKLHEKAVRAVILIIVFVFDPLAVTLLIAANHSMKTQVKPKKSYYKPKTAKQPLWALKAAKLKEKKKRGIVEIDKNSIVEMK
jgi:hypothetical protein